MTTVVFAISLAAIMVIVVAALASVLTPSGVSGRRPTRRLGSIISFGGPSGCIS